MTAPLPRRLLAEFLGTTLLVTAVVGSGIMAARLSPGDIGLQLLQNSIATARRPRVSIGDEVVTSQVTR